MGQDNVAHPDDLVGRGLANGITRTGTLRFRPDLIDLNRKRSLSYTEDSVSEDLTKHVLDLAQGSPENEMSGQLTPIRQAKSGISLNTQLRYDKYPFISTFPYFRNRC